jgi:anaerobic magnesium-protoporphyrin IX monomethyl ester cyclase
VFKCDFCASKITMALGYRKKSPERCAAEVREMYARGFREFMLADDIFTSDQKWAGQVCDAIHATGIDMAWSCTNGIRVESADEQLFRRLRRAGCYRVSFGFESGNDEVLKGFGKGGKATLELGVRAVRLAREAGIDTNGYFQLGLSVDTEQTMRETIAYARRLPLDMLKFGITIAFPGTPMFEDYAARGLIRSYDWDEYHMYTDKALFAHPNMSYETVRRFMDHAYKSAILGNPGFHARRLLRGLRTGELLWDAYYFAKFLWMPTVSGGSAARYYAQERWPRYDWKAHPPGRSTYATVRATPPQAPLAALGTRRVGARVTEAIQH